MKDTVITVISFILICLLTSLLVLEMQKQEELASVNPPQQTPDRHIKVLNKEVAMAGCRYTLALRGYEYIYELRTEERVVIIDSCDAYQEEDILRIIK